MQPFVFGVRDVLSQTLTSSHVPSVPVTWSRIVTCLPLADTNLSLWALVPSGYAALLAY